jgi:hypothetical protein
VTSTPSDVPFDKDLGTALNELQTLAHNAKRGDQERWVEEYGKPVKELRNGVVHAVTFTAEDGSQAIMGTRKRGSERFQNPELREVTRRLIEASISLPE